MRNNNRDPRAARLACAALAAAAAFACGDGPPPLSECVAAGELAPLCRFQNPEDLAVIGDWLLVSQMKAGEKPGSLVAFRPSDGALRTLYPIEGDTASQGECAAGLAPPAASFEPHGIDLAGTTLLAINHGSREAVEEFAVGADGDGPTLSWQRCTALPEDASANDVAALNSGGFVATKMLERPQLLGLVKLLFGSNTGVLLRRLPASTAWEEVPNTEGRAPNGVEEAPDGALFIAEWAARRVVRVAPDGSARSEVPLDFAPDNLAWASDGRLLVAGQRATPLQMPRCASVETGACSLASVVVAIDPATLTVTPLVDDDPAATIGAASIAVEYDGALWVGTFAGDRIVKRAGVN